VNGYRGHARRTSSCASGTVHRSRRPAARSTVSASAVTHWSARRVLVPPQSTHSWFPRCPTPSHNPAPSYAPALTASWPPRPCRALPRPTPHHGGSSPGVSRADSTAAGLRIPAAFAPRDRSQGTGCPARGQRTGDGRGEAAALPGGQQPPRTRGSKLLEELARLLRWPDGGCARALATRRRQGGSLKVLWWIG
jgi:hypothetical protein